MKLIKFLFVIADIIKLVINVIKLIVIIYMREEKLNAQKGFFVQTISTDRKIHR